MVLLHRFLVLLMRRLFNFCHDQQLVVPLLVAASFELWQFSTRRLTLSSFLEHPLTETFPAIAAVGIVVIYQIVMTAADLNHELNDAASKDVPRILHPDNAPRKPSPISVALIAIVLASFVLLGEGFLLERAFPIDVMRIQALSTPVPPAYAFIHPSAPLPVPPWYVLNHYQTMPPKVGEVFQVRMYLDNRGSTPGTIFGATLTKRIDAPPKAYEERKTLEESLWKEMEQNRLTQTLTPLSIPVMESPGRQWILLESAAPLSQDDIDKMGKSAVIYVMSDFRDSTGKNLIESCFRTIPSSGDFVFCLGHNR